MGSCCSELSQNGTVYRNMDSETNEEGCVSWCEIDTEDPSDDLQDCLKTRGNLSGAYIIGCSDGANQDGYMNSASIYKPSMSFFVLLCSVIA